MKLIQVRKGQFVFYQNELHKVYSVKPMFRKSVHLYRLKDMQQVLTSAKEITYFRPHHQDTFIFYGKRYTIDKDMKPKQGDYILITQPAPDLLDHYALNDIEKVDRIEDEYVLTTNDNAVKHYEYVMLSPGRGDNTREVAYYDKTLVPEEQQIEDESVRYLAEQNHPNKPVVGDVYMDVEERTEAMIVAITPSKVTFGHGTTVHISELMDEDRYVLVQSFDNGI